MRQRFPLAFRNRSAPHRGCTSSSTRGVVCCPSGSLDTDSTATTKWCFTFQGAGFTLMPNIEKNVTHCELVKSVALPVAHNLATGNRTPKHCLDVSRYTARNLRSFVGTLLQFLNFPNSGSDRKIFDSFSNITDSIKVLRKKKRHRPTIRGQGRAGQGRGG